MKNRISLRIDSTALCAGKIWDNRFIRAILVSYLIVPTLHNPTRPEKMSNQVRSDYRRRKQVREVFTVEVALRLASPKAKRGSSARERFNAGPRARFNADRVRRLLKAFPTSSYLPEWSSQANVTAAGPLRDIFSVGLFVLILDDLLRQSTSVTIGEAHRKLHAHYQTGQLWVTNSNDFPKAWARLRPVAHLAAALVRLLHEAKALTRQRGAFTEWRKQMPKFLALAKYYEELLIERKVSQRASWDRHKARPRVSTSLPLLNPCQLWRLPTPAKVAKVRCLSALPTNDRKASEDEQH